MRVLVLLLMLLPGAVLAQVQQTPNTLKLEEGAARPAATLEDVQLLAGHWEGPFMGATAEEVWLPAAGGTMLGMFRMFSEGEVFFYELMHMVEEEGSVSLKNVLPQITDRSYDDLDIADGESASISFLSITYEDVSETERNMVREKLEQYCRRDTEGMIWIVDRLKELID